MSDSHILTTCPTVHQRSRLNDALIFSLSLFSFIRIDLIGQLFVVEAIAGLLLILIISRRRFRLFLPRAHRVLIILGLVWLLGLILSDVYRATPWDDRFRGWFSTTVLLILFITLYQLIQGDTRRVYLLLFGTAAGKLIGGFLMPTDLAQADAWKFAFGGGIALVLVSWVGMTTWKAGHISPFGLLSLFAFGSFSATLGSRSLGAFTILTGLVFWFRTTAFGQRLAGKSIGPLRLTLIGIFGLSGLFLISEVYGLAASEGWLGVSALGKFEEQSLGDFGIILGGRSDLLGAFYAISDSPIIGYGSWAKGHEYRDRLMMLTELGYAQDISYLQYVIDSDDLIPAHSHIFQAWVWGGILGLPFWLYALLLIGKSGIQSFQHTHALAVPVVFLAITGVWHIFFSPFGSNMRFHWAMTLIVVLHSITLITEYRRNATVKHL
ncbi:MAG: hypothetical protein KFB96_24695 [Thiocapsa sp.]|uniref:hypothetical protein n=1 Tax=Thiocapsa sp. TaxID=2024551 RepID=UPI001BCEC796|nr:hypothetical protein [Thiocapsa sp.]QVL48717.1 MAG: hypothetical protein KFB96_24695 [Thiocapsa sp.]